MVNTITYYSKNAPINETWIAYPVEDDGKMIWVRFVGKTEQEAIERATAWYNGESPKNRAGTVQLDGDEVSNKGFKSSWGSGGWTNPNAQPLSVTNLNGRGHANAGKVWLANKELGQKRRVDPAEVDAMMAQGWFRAGPRTQV